MKYKNGLVIGKFMPLHKGHEYLIRFAKEYCENLTVVVDCLKGQTLSPEIRKEMIKDQIRSVKVVALTEFMPQAPSETPDFWDIWKTALKKAAPDVDVVIASMDYGYELSSHLDAEFVFCDIDRESVKISATEIRENPFLHWDLLAESARPYFMKKVCLIGPESTGKSEVVKILADRFNTTHVPEYAKSLIESQDGEFYPENVKQVAYAQIRKEKAIERMINKVLFCDSDVITTMVWSEILFGVIPNELIEIAKNQHYDITYLCKPDTEWVDDIHRNVVKVDDQLTFREEMFNRMEELLKQYGRRYKVISGNNKEDIIEDDIEKMFKIHH